MDTFSHITKLSLQYETLKDIEIDGLSPGLNVIYGPNESGKSRIKEFIEWMSFSSSKQFESLTSQARKNAFWSINNLIAGSMSLRIGNDEFQLSKSNDSNSLSVTPFGSSASQIIESLTDGLTLNHYRNVFSLNLGELTRENSNSLVSEDEIAEVFLNASQTGSGISLSSLVYDLNAEKEALFSESGNATKRKINKLLKNLEEVDKEIRSIQREQKEVFSFAHEISAKDKLSIELDKSASELSSKITELEKIKNNIEIYKEFVSLSQIQSQEINIDLVSEIINIETLLNQCEHHIGDEQELNRLLRINSERELEIDELTDRLNKTLHIDNLNSELVTYEFKSKLENEKQDRNVFQNEMSRAQETFDTQSAELIRLTKRADELNNRIENEHAEQNHTFDVQPEAVPANKKKFTFVSVLGILFGLITTIASTVFSQPIGAIAGTVVTLVAGFVLFTNKRSAKPVGQPLDLKSNNDRESLSQIELSEVLSQMEHYQGAIEKSVEKLKEIETNRSKKKHEFENLISSIGFDQTIEPATIEHYLADYDKLVSLRREHEEVKVRVESLTTWFENFYDQVEKIRSTSNENSTSDRFTSLIHAQTWLRSVLELAKEHKEMEKELYERNARIRDLEKTLVNEFESIEAAEEKLKSNSVQDIILEIGDLKADLISISEEQKQLNQEIGALRRSSEHMSKDTQLRDLMITKQSLIEELKVSHEDYVLAFSAHQLAESAFSQCQRESQPEVLDLAGRYLSKITGNKWNRVIIDLENNLRAKSPQVKIKVSGDLATIEAPQLSQGTQEQLYLSLRLALMQSSKRGKHVPAMFDDIAVNSDEQRLRSISPLIDEISSTRQVFYFTCHEWVANILTSDSRGTLIHL